MVALTDEEADAFCQANRTFSGQTFSDAELCALYTNFELMGSIIRGGGGSCQEIYDECQRFSADELLDGLTPPSGCIDFYRNADACTANVGELTACFEYDAERTHRWTRKFSCDDPFGGRPAEETPNPCTILAGRCRYLSGGG